MVKAFFPSHQQADETEANDLEHTIPHLELTLVSEGNPASNESISNYNNHNNVENASGNALNRAFIANATEDDVFNTTNNISLENSGNIAEISSHYSASTVNSTPFCHRTLPNWSCDSVRTPNQQDLSLRDHERGSDEPTQVTFSSPMNVRTSGDTSEEILSSLRSVASVGRELFLFILGIERDAREALEPGVLSSLHLPSNTNRMDVLNERSEAGGRTMKEIARAFARSPQRNLVRQLAQQVNLQSLNYKTFCDLIFGLFQEGGMTQERVLVFYFFCADLALRAFLERLPTHFQQLVYWTNCYISDRLSTWVQERGGWVTVLQDSVNPARKIAVGVICLSVVVFSAFVWLRIRS